MYFNFWILRSFSIAKNATGKIAKEVESNFREYKARYGCNPRIMEYKEDPFLLNILLAKKIQGINNIIEIKKKINKNFKSWTLLWSYPVNLTK